jgi:hypothetical protein
MSVHTRAPTHLRNVSGPDRPKSVDPSLYIGSRHPLPSNSSSAFGHLRNFSGSSPGNSGFAMSSTPPQSQGQAKARWIPRSKTPAPEPTHTRARSGTGSSSTSSGFFASLQKTINGKDDKSSRERESKEKEKEKGAIVEHEVAAPGRHRKSISTSHATAGMSISRPGTGFKERDNSRDASPSDDDYKARIHQETVQRFRTLKHEAEAQLLTKLRELSSSRNGFRESQKADDKAQRLRREHDRSMLELQRAMAEEEEVRIKEERRRRKMNKSYGQLAIKPAASSTPDAVEDEEEWLWRPEDKDSGYVIVENERGHVRRGSREEAALNRELIRREQQAIWDAARKRSNSGASPPKPNSASQSQSQQALDPRKVRWATNSPVQGRSMSPAVNVPLPSAAPAPTMHERWLPSVQDYAADMREQTKHPSHQRSAPRPIPMRSSSGMGFHAHPNAHAHESGTPESNGSYGSWRDWRASTMFPNGNGSGSFGGGKDDINTNNGNASSLAAKLAMSGGRRAFTPAPTSSASAAAARHVSINAPPVPSIPPIPAIPRKRTLSFTPAAPSTTSSSSSNSQPAVLVAPALMRTSTPLQRSSTPVSSASAAASSASKIRQIVDDREPEQDTIAITFDDASANASNTGSTGSRWKGKAKAAPLAPMDMRSGNATCIGIYQPIVEDVCARMKRELAIAT